VVGSGAGGGCGEAPLSLGAGYPQVVANVRALFPRFLLTDTMLVIDRTRGRARAEE
jgi:hypothetical protein